MNETTLYSLLPSVSDDLKLPLVAFMHGSTGQYGFYNDSLALIASHGAIVVFPFVKSPEKDKSPFTTNTDGKFLVKAIQYAKEANADPESHLYGRVETDKIIVAGHSMGATCTINAAHALKSDPSTILAFAMHRKSLALMRRAPRDFARSWERLSSKFAELVKLTSVFVRSLARSRYLRPVRASPLPGLLALGDTP